MPDKKQTIKKQTVLHTIVCGETAAEIEAHCSNTGYPYMTFRLQRMYLSSTGKQARGATFFAQNAQQIAQAALEASKWINARQQADAQDSQQAEAQ